MEPRYSLDRGRRWTRSTNTAAGDGDQRADGQVVDGSAERERRMREQVGTCYAGDHGCQELKDEEIGTLLERASPPNRIKA
jgi:hypothetical protein